MITIDENTLTSLGINLGDDADSFLKDLEQQLHERVGAALLELLDDEEAKEFIALSEAGDDDATESWINTHIPDYEDVVQDEVDILLGEIAQSQSTQQ